MEVADMLAETRAELDDFQHSSKELEEELERELERTEKTQQDLRAKLARAENERDDWKVRSILAAGLLATDNLHRMLIWFDIDAYARSSCLGQVYVITIYTYDDGQLSPT